MVGLCSGLDEVSRLICGAMRESRQAWSGGDVSIAVSRIDGGRCTMPIFCDMLLDGPVAARIPCDDFSETSAWCTVSDCGCSSSFVTCSCYMLVCLEVFELQLSDAKTFGSGTTGSKVDDADPSISKQQPHD